MKATTAVRFRFPLTAISRWFARNGTGPNGQIVAFEGGNANVFSLVRLNADGSLAARSSPVIFGGGWPRNVAIQADGRILVAGDFTLINGVQAARTNFARLNADGSLEPSFNPAVIPAFWDYTDSLKPLADSRIPVFDGPWLRALTSKGEMDSDFQAIGPVNLHALAEDAQGRLIVAGVFSPIDGLVQIYRWNQDGSLDSTFAPTSVLNEGWLAHVQIVLLQPDGKILVAGSFHGIENPPMGGLNRTNLGRLNPGGRIDESFDAGSPPPHFWRAPCCGTRQLALLDGAKILMAYPAGEVGNWILRRYNVDGSADRQLLVRLVEGDAPVIRAMTLQGGRLLVAGWFGWVNGFPTRAYGLARLLLDVAPESAAVIAPRLADLYYTWPLLDWQEGFEGMGQAELTVRRLGDVRGAATVSFTTRDGSAKAGRDYTAVAGTLSFAPLEMEKSFRLPILNDAEFEPDETLELVLSPSGGVAAVTTNLFTIHDDEVTIRGIQRSPYDSSVWIHFNSVPGQTYALKGSQDLTHWQQLQTDMAYDCVSRFFEYPPATLRQRFYRIKRVP